MNTDDDIFRIFAALDDQNLGYIDKNTFLNTMLEYTSSLGDLKQEEIIRIKNLMNPYEKIHFKEFKDIYLQIQSTEQNMSSLGVVRSQSLSSSESSDVDDSEERTYTKPSFMASPSSARKHGLDLLNQSKASLQRMISGHTHSDSDSSSIKNNLQADSDEWDDLMRDYEQKQKLIESLQIKLETEDVRYQNEKEQTKLMSKKVYELENQIQDMEMNQRSDIKRIKDNYKTEIENVEDDYNEKVSKLNDECSELRRHLDTTHESRDQIQSLYNEYYSKYDDLNRDYRLLQSQLSDCENIFVEYKRVASRQVTELQTERDQLELVNKDLYIELQALKHLAKEYDDIQSSEINAVKTRKKQRVQSAVLPAYNEVKMASLESIPMDSIVPRCSSPAIENDMNRVVHLLTMENRDLVERIAHLETVGFYQKQRLEAVNCLSLADEMDRLSLEEIRKALSIERETVKALRDYMEGMTIKLLTLGHIDVFQLG